MAFDREISDEMIDTLNKKYADENGWWRKLADDPDTLIAIRDRYLNVYCNGCNLAKVEYKNSKLKAGIHYKYLLKNKIETNPYINQKGGEFEINRHAEFFIASLEAVDDIKKSTKAYGGIEKLGVHQIIRANPNIVDTEIALSEAKSDKDDSENKNSRIDFCAIQEEDGKLLLRFFEAKHYTNKELRAEQGREIKVIVQLERYRKSLKNQHDAILLAYKKLIRQTAAIEGVNILGKNWATHPGINTLEIDPEPRLVVFGFDQDQKDGVLFKKRMDALRAELDESPEKKRLLLKGDPKGFTSGISS